MRNALVTGWLTSSVLLLATQPALAHVKWFAPHIGGARPQEISLTLSSTRFCSGIVSLLVFSMDRERAGCGHARHARRGHENVGVGIERPLRRMLLSESKCIGFTDREYRASLDTRLQLVLFNLRLRAVLAACHLLMLPAVGRRVLDSPPKDSFDASDQLTAVHGLFEQVQSVVGPRNIGDALWVRGDNDHGNGFVAIAQNSPEVEPRHIRHPKVRYDAIEAIGTGSEKVARGRECLCSDTEGPQETRQRGANEFIIVYDSDNGILVQ